MDTGIGAGTQRLLAALFPAAQPSRPSPRVRPHPGSLDRRFGQFVVPGGRREDPRFRLFALTDWSPIHRAECCLAIFPLPWLVPAGTGAGAAARPRCSPRGRLSRPLLFGR